ncbi:ArsB/NhaD family transporter [Desulfosporosinus sp. PR]|uniref:sodium:proton antiporter n=1 Tax=Candidatus Desulfosporosinus nitrosoreducens TaxID=3401928 RepID=UPI0027FEA1B8|nr:ArsB/NhaD family transporter [Desulfosporosinus sp. PR]MDQ7092122.1 ArsB/NhaD family transporter [Desulfosporosinus sp. PR]
MLNHPLKNYGGLKMSIGIAASIFVISYFFIITEKFPRAVTAMCGASLMIISGILTQAKAIEHIDWNTLGLLIGMMLIVDLTRRSGIFSFLAIWVSKKVKGNPLLLMLALSLLTALLSACLDNVTTVLLIVPITLSIAEQLETAPLPFLFSQILMSNIGGTATLIGDPPNIMIAGQTGLSFMDFILNLGPAVLLIIIVTLFLFYLVYRHQLITREELKVKLTVQNEWHQIKDFALLKKSLTVLSLVIIGFSLHSILRLETASIALGGAMLLMLWTREEPEDIFLAIEWPTLFFFAGLFVLVGGLVETGALDYLAKWSMGLTSGNPLFTALLILVISALLSSILDNIPYVATMIPLIQKLALLSHLTPAQTQPLWWALSLGACLGGNGTLVGASANLIVAGIAEKNGLKIRYSQFFKVGFPFMLLSIVISASYLILRYF